jgi:hypothetical protein
MSIFLKPKINLVSENPIARDRDIINQNSAIIEEDPKPIWGRLIFAAIILITLLFAAIITAKEQKSAELSKTLVHSFELLLGAFIGILTGEAASKSS